MTDPARLANLYVGALTLWREARGSPREGKAGVAWAIIRRTRKPGWYNAHRPGSVVAACVQPWQFSSMTDPKDSQLTRFPLPTEPEWVECVDVMERALAGTEPDPTPGADSYYAVSIPPPDWAKDAPFIGQVGHHRFYRVLT